MDREADAERAHCRRFSVSLQNAPQLRELVLSAPLHPLLGSSAPSRVRGQGAHLLPASTGDVHGRVGELCYKLRLLLGALSPRAQGTRSLCYVPAPSWSPVSLDLWACSVILLSELFNGRKTQAGHLGRGGKLGGGAILAAGAGRACHRPVCTGCGAVVVPGAVDAA